MRKTVAACHCSFWPLVRRPAAVRMKHRGNRPIPIPAAALEWTSTLLVLQE
jgi:hypothetical protein